MIRVAMRKPTKAEVSDAARLMQKRRKTWTGAGGRPKILRPCPFGCGVKLGGREMRVHKPVCPKRSARSRVR